MPDNKDSSDIQENYQKVNHRLQKALHSASRVGKTVELIAVSKNQTVEKIDLLIKLGHRVFGENRVQEAKLKWPAIKMKYSDVQLHLIGPLQTNKVKEAVDMFDVIESLDRVKLATKLSKEISSSNRTPDLLVQINTGKEISKSGVNPEDADEFIIFCQKELHLNIKGLMCIPPVDDEKSKHFSLLHKIAKKHSLKYLSMGMSADFDTAILFGATHVRVGTAIFGKRH
jgi:pyridoxal phosphate enzyme (YggS family)|tara:strand:+ start:1174 stop:1857 length:684 start_codon:yes stop_codon:yes gene_type:complete